jgi:hypothetical protein
MSLYEKALTAALEKGFALAFQVDPGLQRVMF